jgi:hypothetical protein
MINIHTGLTVEEVDLYEDRKKIPRANKGNLSSSRQF